jgi:peptidoglycan-N-acetylglucosamine deacetylase
MSLRLIRPGIFSRVLYPGALFRLETREKVLCLTFDDGPCPEATEKILKILSENSIQSIFFCNGENAEKYPELVDMIRMAGHVTGNHGFRHLDGLKTGADLYLENAVRAESLTSKVIFRPPYGRMTPAQYREISLRFRIIMWDLMPFDFDRSVSPERCLEILKEKTRPGSVIVLHDSPGSKAPDILAEYIRFCTKEGYRFDIPQDCFII